MAKVNHCVYCSKQVINKRFHDECRVAHLEILLREVQTLLKAGSATGIPSRLRKKILAEDFSTKTLEEFRKRQSDKVTLAMKKEMRQRALTEHLQKAHEEFEKQFPFPDPPQY